MAALGVTRLIYYGKPDVQRQKESGMSIYISKQIQTTSSLSSSEFDAKTSQLLEQFMSDAITITDTAKTVHAHSELQQFATDSTYSWGYNREGVRIIEENLGLKPKHEGKHCDSVGSC